MQVRWFAVTSSIVLALGLGMSACGDDDDDDGGGSAGTGATATDAQGGNKTLTIYSSLPKQGASRPQSLDVIRGEKLALKQAGNKAGNFTIKYVDLDDATAAAGKWEAGQVSANARKAAQDDSAIAYLGEFNSGASAISIPITNEAGLLQISPSNTALGLTKAGDGAEKGEPEKYYPTGKRTYGRVVPVDIIQGKAQAVYMGDEGVKKLYVLNDKEVYGQGVATNTATSAKAAGIEIVGEDGWDGKASNYRALAGKIQASGADGVFLGGIIDNNAVQLAKDIYAADPKIKQFGPDGVATTDYTKELPTEVQAVTYLTAPTVDPASLPPAGQKFHADYQAEYGEAPDEIDPYAVYGYEAMSVALAAIAKGGDDKQAVVDAFFDTVKTDSVLGPYEIDDDGDTTLTTYGAYLAKGGKFVFSKALKIEG